MKPTTTEHEDMERTARELEWKRAFCAAWSDVYDERAHQQMKWGEQNHPPCVWSAIMTEECGELAEAALHIATGGANEIRDLRTEAIHCAAVAVQIIEWMDRQAAKATAAGKGAPVIPREIP